MADGGEKLVLDEETGKLVFTVETVYMFPQATNNTTGQEKTIEYQKEDDKPVAADSKVRPSEISVIRNSRENDSGFVKVNPQPGVQQDVWFLSNEATFSGDTRNDATSSPYSTPKRQGPVSWKGPRPWMVTGKAQSEVLPLPRDSRVTQSVPVAGRPATPPVNVKSPKIRSAPHSPTGRYPWSSVLRSRSGSMEKNPRDYVEKPIPIDFEDSDDDDKKKEENRKEKGITEKSPLSSGLKRPLVRLFPKPTMTTPGQSQSEKVMKKDQGQYEVFDSSSWSHVASDEQFEFLPPQPQPDLQHASASDQGNDLPLDPKSGDLQVSTRTDHSSTKRSKHVTDSATAETETTTNVTSDHSITWDPTTGTTIKTFKEHVQEVTTLTATITTDSLALESPGGDLRSASLVKKFFDEVEFSNRRRASSFPEKDMARPKRTQLSVPSTPPTARSPQTPGSDIVEFACGVKFEKHSPSPKVSPKYRVEETRFKFEEDQTKKTFGPKKLDSDLKSSMGELYLQPEMKDTLKQAKSENDLKQADDQLKGDRNMLEVPGFHIEESMSLEDMLHSLKTYLSSDNLLGDSPKKKPVEEEIQLKYEDSNFRKTSTGYVETERKEEIYIQTKSPKVVRVQPELERTLDSIRSMLSSSTEFLDTDIDLEDLPSPFGDSTEENNPEHADEDIPPKLPDKTSRLKHRRHLSKSESDFEETLNTVRDFLSSDAEILDDETSSDTDNEGGSGIEDALQSVQDALNFSSGHDNDYNNKLRNKRWQQIPNQNQTTAIQASVDSLERQTTGEVPFQRYVDLESKVSDTEISRTNTISSGDNVSLPDQPVVNEIDWPELRIDAELANSDCKRPSEMDDVDFNSGPASPAESTEEAVEVQGQFAAQMSTEFAPRSLQVKAFDIHIDEKDDKEHVCEKVVIHKIEPQNSFDILEEIRLKHESGSAADKELARKSSDSSKSSNNSSIDLEDPPIDCSSPDNITKPINVVYSKAMRKPVSKNITSNQLAPKDVENFDPGYESIQDGVPKFANKKQEPDPDYESIKDENDDLNKLLQDLGIEYSSKTNSDSSLSDPGYMCCIGGSSLSILSDLGNTQSDFGSTEYLYVDLDYDLAENLAKREERGENKLQNLQLSVAPQVDILKKIGERQEILKLENKNEVITYTETKVIQEEICEKTFIQKVVPQNSFDILEDMRLKVEPIVVTEREQKQIKVMKVEETRATQKEPETESLDEVISQLNSNLIEAENGKTFEPIHDEGEGGEVRIQGHSLEVNEASFLDTKQVPVGKKEHPSNSSSSSSSSDEASRSLEEDLEASDEFEESYSELDDKDKNKEVHLGTFETAMVLEKKTDENQNLPAKLDKEMTEEIETVLAELENLQHFDTTNKTPPKDENYAHSTPRRDREIETVDEEGFNKRTNSNSSKSCKSTCSESDSEEDVEMAIPEHASLKINEHNKLEGYDSANVIQKTFKTGIVLRSPTDSLDNLVQSNRSPLVSSTPPQPTEFTDEDDNIAANVEEPLPTTNRADRLSLHKDDSFNLYENKLEAMSAEKFSSSSESVQSEDLSISPESSEKMHAHGVESPPETKKRTVHKFRSWPRFLRGRKESKKKENKYVTTPGKTENSKQVIEKIPIQDSTTVQSTSNDDSKPTPQDKAIHKSTTVQITLKNENSEAVVEKNAIEEPHTVESAVKTVTEHLFISSATHSNVQRDERKAARKITILNVSKGETSNFNKTGFKYESSGIEEPKETTLRSSKKLVENESDNGSEFKVTRKKSGEPNYELSIDEIVSRLHNKPDEDGYKPNRRRKRPVAAAGRKDTEGDEDNWEDGDEVEDDGDGWLQDISEERKVSSASSNTDDTAKSTSESSSDTPDELKELGKFGYTDGDIHITSYAKLEEQEQEIRKIKKTDITQSSSVQFIVTESKSTGPVEVKKIVASDNQFQREDEKQKVMRDPHDMTIDEIVSSLPGAAPLNELTRTSSFGSGVRRLRQVSEPSPLVRSQSVGSEARTQFKPVIKRAVSSPKSSPLLAQKSASSKGQF